MDYRPVSTVILKPVSSGASVTNPNLQIFRHNNFSRMVFYLKKKLIMNYGRKSDDINGPKSCLISNSAKTFY